MYEKLKQEIKDILEITKECPEALQEKCFEILLNSFLEQFKPVQTTVKEEMQRIDASQPIDNQNEVAETSSSGDEITENDFHVRVRKFLNTNNVSIADLNKIYYKENGQLMPFYESMHSTKMSECQIRLTVLTAFENGFANGDFVVNGEVIRKRCQDLKCYDGPNFASIFKNNSSIFDNWADKYDKNTSYTLSVEGKKILAQTLIKIIAEY